jgi:hypothetical protein
VAAARQAVLEAEDRQDAVGAGGGSERRIVGEAQIAAEPDDADGHDNRCSRKPGHSSIVHRRRAAIVSV